MNLSYWEKDTYFSNIDVLIIGSGIVGLTAALELKSANRSRKIIVIERGYLPCGASSKNAGFSCFGSVSELLDDLTKNSEDNVFQIVEKRWKGLQQLRKNLGEQNLELYNLGGYEVFNDEVFYGKCADKIPYLNNMLKDIIGNEAVYKNADAKISQYGFNHVSHLIENSFEGQINTGKMISSLIRKVQEMGVIVLNSLEVNQLQENENHVEV